MSRPVLLTRPAGQIAATATLLRRAGHDVLELPLTGIASPARPPAAALLAYARDADWLIFTSRNAVLRARSWLEPDQCGAVVAVGRASASEAEKQGWPLRWAPAGGSSEALLAEPGAPQLGGRICIIGGSGGRRHLKAALQRRGAEVRKLIVYRRVGLEPAAGELRAAIARQPLLVFSSGHAMRQWQALCARHDLSRGLDLPLLVASRRLCKLARPLGYTQPAQALPQVSDAALLNALTERHDDPGQERSGRSARGSGEDGAADDGSGGAG